MRFKVEFTGLAAMAERSKRLQSDILTDAEGILNQGAAELIALTKPDVPAFTGALRSSGFTEPAKIEGLSVSVVCGFGQDSVKNLDGVPTSKYAIPVHENLSAKHPVGKAKYLEDKLNEFAPEVEERLKGIL